MDQDGYIQGCQFQRVCHAAFVTELESALEEFDVDPRQLTLEVTESAFMQEVDAIRHTFHAVRDLGVRLALDDFGTGYSSLSHLRNLPLDRLKIDRSFITEVCSTRQGAALTDAIIAMAHSLEMDVVAEGVETQAQADVLERAGCDALQGYLFSPAVGAAAFAKLLAGRPATDRANPTAEPKTALVSA